MDAALIWLVPQAALFALWAFLMFRTLFRLRSYAERASGQVFPGLGATLASYRAFLTEPAFARDRRTLGPVTLALLLVTLGFVLTRP